MSQLCEWWLEDIYIYIRIQSTACFANEVTDVEVQEYDLPCNVFFVSNLLGIPCGSYGLRTFMPVWELPL